jgi:hypothetical protein
MTVVKITLKPGYGTDGKYAGDGRYPSALHAFEEFPDIDWSTISLYATSDDPLDRIAALAWINDQRVRLPEMWVVIEDPHESPNLQREGWTRTMEQQISQAWSVHFTEEDAIIWRDGFQAKSDAQVAKHPWWGDSARRKYAVVKAAGAPASQLRQPGAQFWTAAFE